VIVGWSTRNRPLLPTPIMMLPDARALPHGLAQLPEKLGRSGVAVSRAWSGLDRHDTGSTTARSVDEVALIRDNISHYAPVLIAPLSIQIRRAGVQGGPEFFPCKSGGDTPPW
jgi:hypothetical protein